MLATAVGLLALGALTTWAQVRRFEASGDGTLSLRTAGGRTIGAALWSKLT